jgi:hypothetical protein
VKGVVDSHGPMVVGMEAIPTSQPLILRVLLPGTRTFLLESIIWGILRRFHLPQSRSQGSLCIHGMLADYISPPLLLISMLVEATGGVQVWGLQDLFIPFMKPMKKTTWRTLLKESELRWENLHPGVHLQNETASLIPSKILHPGRQSLVVAQHELSVYRTLKPLLTLVSEKWVSDWAAADMLLNSQTRTHSNAGRLSPTRRAQLIAASTAGSVSGEDDSGRTASNLSERSVAISGFTVSRSGSSSQSQGRSRANSLRGFITGMNPFTSTILSTTVASTSMSPVFDGPGPHGPRNPPRSAGSTSGTSFNTAHTSFMALQAEGESLLPRPGDDLSAGEYSPTRSQPDSLLGSPSKSKPSSSSLGKGHTQGWLGSLRRVFVGGNTSPESPTYSGGSRDNSPSRPFDYNAMSMASVGAEPRRTVSAGATLWRRKQGKGDWEDSASTQTGRSNTFTGSSSLPRGVVGAGVGDRGGEAGAESDDEWDIERAVENRVVQVMFTVPKEKLRVVNHDFEDEKSEVGSLRSRKGSGRRSVKDLFGITAAGEDLDEKKAEEAASEPLLDDIDENAELQEPRDDTPRARQKDKGKSKVLELVEKIEGRSPDHSPTRS